LSNIIIIDIILAGDNALIIAMAISSLPHKQRYKGIIIGCILAIVLRIIITLCVAQILTLNFLRLIGGILITWIAIKLLINNNNKSKNNKKTTSLWQTIYFIIIADITMSLDNVLAIAGASHGNPFLLVFGLTFSIPFIIFTSNLFAYFINRYQAIIYLGTLILCQVGGEMIINDPLITKRLKTPPIWGQYIIEIFCATGIIIMANLYLKAKIKNILTNKISI